MSQGASVVQERRAIVTNLSRPESCNIGTWGMNDPFNGYFSRKTRLNTPTNFELKKK